MKIRTDFVTNSSSSSYCVSLGLQLKDKRNVWLRFYPKGEDGTGDVDICLNSNVNKFIKAFGDCKTIEEIKNLFVNSVDLTDMFFDFCEDYKIKTTDQLLKALKNFDPDSDYNVWGGSYIDQIFDEFSLFKSKMDRIKSKDEIKYLIIDELYRGWGEFAREGIRDYLCNILPKQFVGESDLTFYGPYEGDQLDEIGAFLKTILPEDDAEDLIDHIENDTVCAFDATVDTIVDMTTGEIKKEYEFDKLG